MKLEALVVAVYSVCAAFGLASSCVRSSNETAPTITAEPPQPATPPVQDADICSEVCQRAQIACRVNKPKPEADCEAKCRDAARVDSAPSLGCLAVNFTCDEDCP